MLTLRMQFLALFLLTSLISTASYAKPLSVDTAQKLRELRTSIRHWAPLCADGTFTTDGSLNSDGSNPSCPHGDMMIFAGLLCLSGEKDRCEDVRKSQDQTTGRWWRSPGLIDLPSTWATFSRDQAKGAMAYLVATKDSAAAEKWMNYVEFNHDRLCAVSPEGSDSCSTRAGFWNQTHNIWKYLGLPLRKKMTGIKYLIERFYDPIEASVQKADYPMHLTAANVYIDQEIEKRGTKIPNTGTHEKIADILTRREPQNPFFHYLANGSDEEGAELVLKYCPQTKPVNPGTPPDWIWQRGFNWKEKGETVRRWMAPSGWECIFAVNLYVGPE